MEKPTFSPAVPQAGVVPEIQTASSNEAAPSSFLSGALPFEETVVNLPDLTIQAPTIQDSTIQDPTRYGDWERKGKCVDF
jgi:Protein of unknown function (DUF1674)